MTNHSSFSKGGYYTELERALAKRIEELSPAGR